MAVNLIMLGPPGAGKGTQAERLAASRGIPKISTGDILREAVHDGTEIGRSVKAIMDSGRLVGDDVMIGIVRGRLNGPDVKGGFVLDGFPRTVAQASALDELMAGRDPLIVIDIVVPEIELVRRLSTRLICEDCGVNADGLESGRASAETIVMPAAAVAGSGAETTAAMSAQADLRRCRRCGGRLVQRSDDNDAVVLNRLKVYQQATQPLIEFYSRRPTFRIVNGAQPADRVAADLAEAVEAVANGRLKVPTRSTAS